MSVAKLFRIEHQGKPRYAVEAGGAYRLIVDVKDRSGSERLARSDPLILKVAEREGSSGMADICAEIEIADTRPAEFEQA